MQQIVIAESVEHIAQVRALFEAYARSLDFSLCFQGFTQELASLPGDYAAPRGTLLLALSAGRAAGCIGVRPLDCGDPGGHAELKRLYVHPDARGTGLGAHLTRSALVFAQHAGYRAVRLDTLASMRAALRLYETLGFSEIASYYDNPLPGARYLELKLSTPGAGAAPPAMEITQSSSTASKEDS